MGQGSRAHKTAGNRAYIGISKLVSDGATNKSVVNI